MPPYDSILWPLVKTALFAATFMAFTLYWLPLQFIRAAHATLDLSSTDSLQIAGLVLLVLGLAIAVTCVLDFAVAGGGTPAPFDPPKFLVRNLLYRYVRNPMYIGALLILAGQALVFRPMVTGLLWYAAGFWICTHTFVVLYEEPHLRRVFGGEYEEYCKKVPRWLPRLKPL